MILNGFWVSIYLYTLRKIRQKKWPESGFCLKKSDQGKHILLLILEKKKKKYGWGIIKSII